MVSSWIESDFCFTIYYFNLQVLVLMRARRVVAAAIGEKPSAARARYSIDDARSGNRLYVGALAVSLEKS